MTEKLLTGCKASTQINNLYKIKSTYITSACETVFLEENHSPPNRKKIDLRLAS